MASNYIREQLMNLRPLSTELDNEPFKLKITSPYGETHWININYPEYFQIAKVLLGKDDA